MQRNLQPGVFIDRTPAGETNTTAWSQPLAQVRKRCDGITEEHHSETRDDQFGAEILKWQVRRVAEETGRVGELAQSLLRTREHRFGDIDSDDTPGRTHGTREFEGCGAAPAPDVQHS